MIVWLLWTTKTNLKIHHTVECDVALNVKCFHSLSTSFSDLDYQTKEDKINQYDKAWATIVSIKVITPNNCVGHLNCFCFCFKLRSKQFRIKTVDDTWPSGTFVNGFAGIFVKCFVCTKCLHRIKQFCSFQQLVCLSMHNLLVHTRQ